MKIYDFSSFNENKLEKRKIGNRKQNFAVISYRSEHNRIHNPCNCQSICPIYSIKRLSDGSIFSIGDKVISTMVGELEIKNFEISEKNKIIIYCIDDRNNKYEASIREINKEII